MASNQNQPDAESPEFSVEFLRHLVGSETVGRAFIDKLGPKDLPKPYMRVIWGVVKDSWLKHKEWPNVAALSLELAKYYDGTNLQDEDKPLVDDLLDSTFTASKKFDSQYFIAQGEQYLERRRARLVYQSGIDGKYPSVDKAIEDLLKIKNTVRRARVQSVDPTTTLQLTEIGNVVSTGLVGLDSRLPGGGHMCKRTMLIIAYTSNGKSTMLRTMELGAALAKHKTLTITLEDSVQEVSEKVYANLAGIPASLIQHPKYRTPEMLKKLREYAELISGYYRIVDPFDPESNGGRVAPGPLSVEDLAQIVDAEKQRDPEIEFVTIDYLNRIRADDPSKDGDESRDLRHVAELLKDRIAKPYKVALATCAQSTGDAFNKAVLDISDTARSKESAWAFDVVGTLGSPRELKNGFNEVSIGSVEGEKEALAVAQALSLDDLLQGKCPLKMVTFNLAKVRGGMKGHFPIYADFCYGRFVENEQVVQTILGPRTVGQIIEEQTRNNR